MILEQYYLGCLAHASYLIGDEDSGHGVIVDPQRDVDSYLEEAERRGLSIKDVILTHFHADFVAGHLELRERTGATIHLGWRGHTEYGMNPVSEGDVLTVGQVRLEFLETPGHTPESICVLVFDECTRPHAPHAVLTGDTLFIGDVGRPDLMAAKGVSARQLAEMMYDSLHDKLMKLPDETLVYPAHGAGSLCGRNMSSETVSTIGDQRRLNYALQPMSRDEFAEAMLKDLPEAPAYFSFDAELNQKERETLEESLERALVPLGIESVLELQQTGAQILDTRPMDDYAEGHLDGSINISLDGSYASWAGTVLSSESPIVLACDEGDERESAMRLGRIGFDKVVGFLEGGMQSLSSGSASLRQSSRLSVEELIVEQNSELPPLIIDVRSQGEVEAGRIRNSHNIPLPQLLQRISELPAEENVVCYCAAGYRSSIAASLLRRHGFVDVEDLAGGFEAWERDGAPVFD